MFKNFTALGILTLSTVAVWIGFNIHHNLTTSQISEVTQKRVEMIPSSFDNEALDMLGTRRIIEVDLAESSKITSLTSPTPSANSVPTPTISSSPTPSSTVSGRVVITATPTP